MIQCSAFVLVSVFLIFVSRKTLFRTRSHGFYRFFAWELILALVVLNAPYWMGNIFASFYQVISGLFLMISLGLVVHGMHLLKVVGKPNQNRAEIELLEFEKTSRLVTVGAFKYIRHPLYSSLLFLAWGAFFKHPSSLGLGLALSASVFLVLTAKRDEAGCVQHFGPGYQTYMQGTKMFVPLLY